MLTIAKAAPEPAQDQQELYSRGLEHVRQLARRLWTDHNIHDPGITILELASYALTDLAYRASLPVEDLLASADGNNAEEMKKQFFTARQILPGRPLTIADYRKLLIDLPGVKNAWIQAVDRDLYADVLAAQLRTADPGGPGVREVAVRGLYQVLVELMENVTGEVATQGVLEAVAKRLQANRNLCEDFVAITTVAQELFIVCAELELSPDADLARVHAEVLFLIGRYLAADVPNYGLEEMRGRRKPDGRPHTTAEIFAGPPLDCGFIDDDELARADLRAEVRLSDVISVVMDIEGVQAVRDIHINPAGATAPPTDRWRVKVSPGRQPILDHEHCRLVLYKRNIPMLAQSEQVRDRLSELGEEARGKVETVRREDLPIPLGKHRAPGRYYSFQNHFPALYGLGPQGLPSGATEARKALAHQLRAYLLFFDQMMANGCAQLSHLKQLFSTDPDVERTYFYQAVDSFPDWRAIYPSTADATDAAAAQTIAQMVAASDPAQGMDRRNRFLNHLLARFAEQFHEYVAITSSALGTDARSAARVKCEFLRSYPAISADRGLGYDHTLAGVGDLWNTTNVSGLERRLCRLLGISSAARRDLGTTLPDGSSEEGMYLIENLLLREGDFEEPLLRICVDPTCADCVDDDPYSYRIHVVLPAYAGRFRNMDFRRFAEEVIRQETPAHILPKVCWIDQAHMQKLERSYRAWLEVRASGPAGDRKARLQDLVDALYTAKNVYPTERLRDCVPGDEQPKFILGRTTLGTLK